MALASERKKRVLVVEDMASLREHLVETLNEADTIEQVVPVANGLEALAAIDAQEQPFDVILTDITMPKMDGEELIHELKQRRYPAAIVVLTAHGQDEIIIRCMKGGASDYLVKPVGIDDLVLAVTTAANHPPNPDLQLERDFDPNGWFEVSGGSDYSVLYRYRKFLGILNKFRLPDDVTNEVRITLEELGRNAIEWGNDGDPSKKVRFGCRILPAEVIILISDEGQGFVPDSVPDPSIDPLGHIKRRQEEGKRLGGYGVHLVRNIMDKVTWNDDGNKVIAIKYL